MWMTHSPSWAINDRRIKSEYIATICFVGLSMKYAVDPFSALFDIYW